jgi:hypothetical protein
MVTGGTITLDTIPRALRVANVFVLLFLDT